MRSVVLRGLSLLLPLLAGCYRSHQLSVDVPDAADASAGRDGAIDAGTAMDTGGTGGKDEPVYLLEDNCVVLRDGDLAYSGQYDAFCANAYLVPLLPNRSGMFRDEASGPKPGRIVVNLEETRTGIETARGDRVTESFTTPLTGSVEPAAEDEPGGEVEVEIIPESLSGEVGEYVDRKLVIRIELIGRKMPGGEEVTSYPCRFPVEVCSKCLTFFAEGKGSNACGFGKQARSEFEKSHPGAELTGRGYDGSYCVCAAISTDTCDDCGIE